MKKPTTVELYGVVDQVVIDTRKSTCKHLIKCGKKRLKELQQVELLKRDNALIGNILKAIEWNEKIINEEI